MQNKITKFKTINNQNICLGLINTPITIGELNKITEFHVIKNTNHHLLLGLDIITKFNLKLKPNLRVYQLLNKNNKIIEEEIQSNYTNNYDNLSIQIYANYLNTLPNNTNEEKEINQILTQFQSIFSKHKYDIGSINTEMCKIELTSKIPINLRPYPCNQIDQATIDNQIENLLKYNLIHKSFSPYSGPVTLADKKDEGKRSRLCTDLRKLNEITVPDNFPFPLFNDIIDLLYDCEYFTTLDITSGFWHVRMHPKHIYKTAFVTKNDHLEWLVMPFGFRNSPRIFQRIIQNILRKHNLYSFSRNYLDDILIFSKTFKEHTDHIRHVLSALIRENVKLKLSKCKFAQNSVKYLGHLISKNKYKPLNDNTIAIKEFPVPLKVKNVQQFLGKVNYYHKFLPNASKLLEPLYLLLRKDIKFEWTAECQDSFDKVKEYLTSSPILAIYNPQKECFLYTDASRLGIGAVLQQEQSDGKLHPIAYFSRKLYDYQQRYDVTQLECLEIVESIEYWHFYLYHKKFTIFSDHQALKWLKSIKKPNSRLFKWSLKLSQYQFDINYIPGKMNEISDALSRNPVLEPNNNSEHIKIVNLIDKQVIIEAQKDYLNNLPKKTVLENDLIIKIKDNFHKIYVPDKLINTLLEKFHLEFGHIGSKKMLSLISCNYYFKNISEKINQFLLRCEVCQTNKINRKKKLGYLSQVGPAVKPFDIISIDTIGGFSGYNSRKKYIHLAIDNFTRYVWTLSSSTQTAKDFINLIKLIINTNKPKLILADRYTAIISKELKKILYKNDIKITFITVNCQQSNGLCERVNQTIVTRLRCKINDQNQHLSWPKLLTKVTEEYNKTPHSITKFSPQFLMFGIKPYKDHGDSSLTVEQARKIALQNSKQGHQVNKLYYDKKHNPNSFNVNDLVFVENKNDISRKKLEPLMIGPYKIVKKISDISYEIECDKKGKKTDIFHISKLRPVQ